MNNYMITYIGGDQPSSAEEGKKHFAKYKAWLGSLGDNAVVPMQPHKNSRTIKADKNVSEGSTAGISGHTVIQASSIEAAMDIAKGCPFLEINGSLEVAELVKM